MQVVLSLLGVATFTYLLLTLHSLSIALAR